MLDLRGKSIAFIGYGESNKALGKYLTEKNVDFVVRCPQKCDLPRGIRGIFGKGYLDTCEEVVFRSPGVRPDLVRGKSYTEIEYALELSRAFKVGVSGSDGKTTTSTLIYRMLLSGGKCAYLGGNIGYPLVGISESMAKSDFFVTELSSFQLMDMCPFLDVAVVTNVSPNHLDWHRSMDEYVEAKSNIVKNASVAVLNYDNDAVRNLHSVCPEARKIYFSLYDRSDLVGGGDSYVYIKNNSVYFDNDTVFSVDDICLRGDYNRQNVLSAVGATYGIVGKEACRRVAREFCGVCGRQEIVCKRKGVTYVNSSIDTTPTRTVNTLSAFPHSSVVAIMGGYDKCLDYGCLAEELKDLKAVVLCGKNRDKIGSVLKCPVVTVNSLCEAVEVSSRIATEGDFVILTPASASFDAFKNYKEKGMCFEKEAYKIE